MRKFLFILLAFALPTLSAGAVEISGPQISEADLKLPNIQKQEEVFIEANELAYDTEKKIVTASGKVEILKGENVLFADSISYDQNLGTVTANGNVVVVGKEGNAIFTDNFTLKDDFKGGVVNFFRTRLSDGSLLAAAQAKRVDGSRLILTKAVYSPCPICNKELDSNPQWQLKAEKVKVDDVKQKVTYKNATMEVYGYPVFYTPYFSHPTPNADRKTGALIPSFQTDSNLGAAITLPYYWNIAPNIDFTAKPVITSKEGPVAAGELRHMTNYGSYILDGSITHAHAYDETTDSRSEDRDWRGHLFGEGRFDITENWDFGFDGKTTSDDTYLRRYNYGNDDLLTSRAYLERINQRNYSSLQTVHFNGLLEEDDSKITPFALPYTQNHFETAKGIISWLPGSKMIADITGFAVSRELGEDSQRLSINSGIFVPFTTSGGQLIELKGNIRGDQYYMSDSALDSSEQRVIPELSLTWRYPLINPIRKSGSLLLEPIAKLVVSPNRDYNSDFVNEDSQDIEFSDLNMFDNNRYRGIDQVESGTRVYYGLRGGYYEDNFSISYLLGQSYRVEDPKSTTPLNSGIEDSASDYVGRVSASLYDVVDLAYKFRYDRNGFAPRRNEIDLNIDYSPVKLSLVYFNLDYDFTNQNDNREEISGLGYLKVADQWSILLGGTRNLAEAQNIEARTGLLYEGDCTNVLTTIKRDFISDRDAESGTSFGVQIGLKNLGDI